MGVLKAITGEAGLASVFAFLVAGAVAIAFASSAGLYLVARSEGASATTVALLLLAPVVAGVLHAGLCVAALWRASHGRSRAMRATVMAIDGVYVLLQLAIVAGCIVLLRQFGA